MAETVAQPGPRVWRHSSLEIRDDSVAGRGIFATAPIAEGTVVAVKVGHVMGLAEVDAVTAAIGDFSLQIHDDVFLSPRYEHEIADMVVMINHSCDANVGFDGQVTYVALRDIAAGEELCHDYAMMRTAPYELDCACGTAICRGTVTGNDWKLPALQERYGNRFQPHILARLEREIGSGN